MTGSRNSDVARGSGTSRVRLKPGTSRDCRRSNSGSEMATATFGAHNVAQAREILGHDRIRCENRRSIMAHQGPSRLIEWIRKIK